LAYGAGVSQSEAERANRRRKRTERRKKVAAMEKRLTRVAVSMVIAAPVLAMVAIVLGAAEVYPYEYTLPVALGISLGLVGLALLIGACFGLYLAGGGAFVPFGFVFVAGFGLLVLGITTDSDLYRNLGVLLLAITGAVIYGAGASSGTAPRSALNTWGHPAAIFAGSALAVVGDLFDLWWVLLFGAMAVGCGLGAVIGRWWTARRSPEQDA
jgi:hypothetical protein